MTTHSDKDADTRALGEWWARAMKDAGLLDFKLFPADVRTTAADAVRETLAVIRDNHKSAVKIKSDADF